MRDSVFRRQNAGSQVDAQLIVPVGLVEFLDRARALDPGDVDHGVETAELSDGLLEEIGHRCPDHAPRRLLLAQEPRTPVRIRLAGASTSTGTVRRDFRLPIPVAPP